MKIFPLTLLLFFSVAGVCQQKQKTENVILITLDGMRWQEVFNGIDKRLLINSTFVRDSEGLRKKFWSENIEERRKKLMPFLWNVIAKEGQLYGNVSLGNKVNVTNNQWFSYPGYSEILTGYADNERIHSNDKFDNPNTNVLEFINRQNTFKNKVAAFTSWEVFPYIINEKRSGIVVNAGMDKAEGTNPSEKEKLLNNLLAELPHRDETRPDALTFNLGLEYLQKNMPRVFYLSFDETDRFTHEGNYDLYIESANYIDGYIAKLWNWLQSNEKYKGKTTLIITTDHGRGVVKENDSEIYTRFKSQPWRDHGWETDQADQIWLAFLGPDTPALGEMKTEGQLYQNQVAKTLAAFLGLNFENDQKNEGEVIKAAGNFKSL